MLANKSFVGARIQASVQPRSVSARVSSVVVEAKKTKAAEFRGMTAEQIDAEVEKCRRALLDLRFKQRTRQVSLEPSSALDDCLHGSFE